VTGSVLDYAAHEPGRGGRAHGGIVLHLVQRGWRRCLRQGTKLHGRDELVVVGRLLLSCTRVGANVLSPGMAVAVGLLNGVG
jgi:hypothetical protein